MSVRRVALGDVCRVVGGGTPDKSNSAFYGGPIPWATVRDLNTDTITATEHSITEAAVRASAANVIPAGEVVLASRVGLGKVSRLARPTAINQDLRALIPIRPDLLSRDYLFWWAKSVAPMIQAAGQGATVQGVRLPFLKSLALPLPPLAEQLRIVAILDEAFEGISTATANAEKNLVNAQELFESELESEIMRAQATHCSLRLHQVCNRITVGHVGPMKDRYADEGIPFLRSQNVRPFKISLTNMMFIDEVFDAELSKSRLTPGDVAVVRTGYPGTAAVIPESIPRANCADLVIIRPKSEMSPYFLTAFLNSNVGKRAVLGRLVGAAQKHFNIGAARDVEIPVPTRSLQDAFVARLDEAAQDAAELGQAYARKLALLAELRQSTLKRAFNGDMTPAEALAA